MGYSFDYFVGQLVCPACGHISKADESTNMQTKICREPKMFAYREKDKLDLDIGNIERSGYFRVNEPNDPYSFSIIESWECPACEIPYNWALIKITNSQILLIKVIELSENTIKNANYISEDCGYLGWEVNEDGIRQVEAGAAKHA